MKSSTHNINSNKAIIEGLSAFSPLAVELFKYGLSLESSNETVKPYLLAHISREIDAIIRDVLVPKEEGT